MKQIYNFIKEHKVINIIVLAIYLVLLIVGLFNHEFWRDELQAWTIARDLSFVDIIKQMRWEGHPCLWHLILSIPAKLGLHPISMGFISAGFMLFTAILVMYKSPFHWPVKLLMIFSSPFLYFFSIHSRVYSIIPFLFCWLAMIYPKRIEKPILFAIPLFFLINTHIMLAAFIGFVVLFYFIDIVKTKNYRSVQHWISLGIIFLGVVVLFLQIKESLASNEIVSNVGRINIIHSDNLLSDIYDYLYIGVAEEVNTYIGHLFWDSNVIHTVMIAFVILLFIMLILSFRTALISLVSYIFIFLLHAFLWFSIQQRSVMIILLLMVGIWFYYHDMKSDSKKDRIVFYIWEVVLCLFCLISIPYGIKSYKYDVKETVSGAAATAEYMSYLDDDSLYICPLDYVATSITGYIDRDIFYSNIRGDYFTFAIWDSNWLKAISEDDFYTTIDDFAKAHPNNDIYVIHSKWFIFNYDDYIDEMVADRILTPVYKSPWGLNQEAYWIYKYQSIESVE